MSKSKNLFNKYLRVIIFVVFVIVLVYLVIRYFNAFGNVLLVMLGFGAVVLVHEFGHFIIAKLSNIKVEAFSIFMPPILFGIQRTEEGIRLRILPEIFPKEGKEGEKNDESVEGALNFAIGKKGKAGETEYRIGLIPFGGFVKMLGQDDVGAVKSTDDPRSFANKPVHVRAAVIAAGVVFNVISAVIIFMIVFLIGIKQFPAKVGAVVPGSPAAIAGIKPGDEIIAIAGKTKDLDFSDIGISAALSGNDEEVPITIIHPEGGPEEEYYLKAELLQGQSMKLFGIEQASSLTIAKLSDEDANNLYTATGLQPGDRIVSVNGREIRGHWELMQIIEDSYLPKAALSAKRTLDNGENEIIDTEIQLEWLPAVTNDFSSEDSLSHIYSMVPRLKIIALSEQLEQFFNDQDSFTEQSEESTLKEGDIILSIGEIEYPTRKDMNDIARQYEDKELPIRVLRTDDDGIETTHSVTVIPRRSKDTDNVLIGIVVVFDIEHPVVAKTISTTYGIKKLDIPRGATIMSVDGTEVSSFYDIIREIRKYPNQKITLDWRIDEENAGNAAFTVSTNESEFINVQVLPIESIPFKLLEETYKADGPIEAIAMGYRKTVNFIAQTYVTLRRLLTGLVSPRNLIGPVGIMRVSYRIVAEQPRIKYVYFLGLISAVIAVFNFLPVPPLDGGLIVLLLIEKIKGSPISEKTQTIIAYTTWTLILALIIYVTFNDLFRPLYL